MPHDPTHPMAMLKAQIANDQDYAWGWYCNFAMPIMDATGVSGKRASEAAAHLMHHLFDYDMTRHPRYEYGKSGAQRYAEIRIGAERDEDERRRLY